jgi:FtsP/CotA-like multicopper oxidase with cupredoxin domain
MLTRRSLLATSACGAGLAALSAFRPARAAGRPLGPAAEPVAGRTVELDLVAMERPQALPCFGGRELPLWTFSPDTPVPVVRLRLGDRLRARLTNGLPRFGEHTSIHWHGLRIPIDQDGVPFISQPPVPNPGGTFTYDFVPPDTGSFFFHTHCNAVEQLGRGLAGLLIVEGDETEPYDGEVVLATRDWRISDTGEFLPFMTDKGAGTTGTFGTVRSTNGETSPTVEVPASADVRVRLYNVDPTRILEVGLEGAEAAVIAVDGNAVTPFPLESWRLGSAMRIDLVVRTPAAGRTATLRDYRVAEPYPLAVFAAEGEPVRKASFDPAPLARPRIPEPDLADATRLAFEYSSTAAGAAFTPGPDAPFVDDLCLSDRTFWAVNKQSWPADGHNRLPPPLAMLESGRTYVFELTNTSKQFHPIHIHGHTFTVLSSNRQTLPRHLADTVLLVPRERLEVAFVAGSPGDWMFHCHLIEHQETGMMGYVRVV